MSIWNPKPLLKFCQRLPCRPNPAFLGSRYAEPNRLDGFESFQDLLVALRVLNHKLGFAVHGEDNRPMRLLHSAHEGTRFPLEVGKGVDILTQIKLMLASTLMASLTMLSGFRTAWKRVISITTRHASDKLAPLPSFALGLS